MRHIKHCWRTFALCLATVGQAAAAEVVLSGSNVRRVVGAADDPSPARVMRTGTEVIEWDLPNLTPGPYRFDMRVRTGTRDSHPLNIVHAYRLWTVDAAGRETDPVTFRQKPDSVPVRVSKKWPVYIGRILSTGALSLEPGMRVRVAAKAHWAEVREIRVFPAPERDRVSFHLSTPAPFNLYRRGKTMPVIVTARSQLAGPATASVTVALESPYGKILNRKTRQIRLAPRAKAGVEFRFRPELNGVHFATMRATWEANTYLEEMALGVVSVAKTAKLAASSAFGVHPARLTDLYECGFKWVRLWDTGDTWTAHEREGKGRFNFASTEEKVANFRERGFKVLAVLAYSPPWATRHPEISYHAGAGAPFPPKRIADWEDYCRTYMTRFKGRIKHFEVWNEPNTGSKGNLTRGFFRGTVADYIELLEATHKVAREVDPDIRVLGCSGTGDFLTWTESVLAAGGGRYMDILSFHAYTTPRSPEEANLEGRLERLHQIMAKHGIAHMPIWNTEVDHWLARRTGARPATAEELTAKAPPNFAPNWKPTWPYRPVPEADAAAYTVRHYVLNLAAGIERLFWYSQLMCRDRSLRLSCFAVANLAQQIEGAAFDRRVDFGIKNLHLHLFRDGREVKGIAWHAGRGTKTVVFEHGSPVRTLDIWGNPIDLPRSTDGVTLEVGGDPVTVIADAAFFKSARLRAEHLEIPVTDCFVVREVNAKRPVKNHTSPRYHGRRKVFGLPDAGDALGWKLKAVRPGTYEVQVELCTGAKAQLYGRLATYELIVVTDGRSQPLELVPVDDAARRPQAMTTPEGKGRAYGWARGREVVWLEPGSEIHVRNRRGFGFVGSLAIRESETTKRTYVIAPTSAPARIDGRPTELAKGPKHDLRRRKQVVIGVADPFASTTDADAWRGPGDLSGSFRIARAGSALYVAIDVIDAGAIRPSPKGAYNGDCVEVFLDLRAPREVGSAVPGEGVYQIFLPAPEGKTASEVKGRMPEGAKAMAWRTAKGWAAELLIPVPGLNPGRELGFDIAIDDDDTGNGRKSQIVWHGTSRNFQDPSAYGRFRVE